MNGLASLSVSFIPHFIFINLNIDDELTGFSHWLEFTPDPRRRDVLRFRNTTRQNVQIQTLKTKDMSEFLFNPLKK